MIKKSFKPLIKSISLLAIPFLLSNCGPSLQTQIKGLSTEFSTLLVDQDKRVSEFKNREQAFNEALEQFRFSLTNLQIEKKEQAAHFKNEESIGVFLSSLSPEQSQNIMWMAKEYNALSTIYWNEIVPANATLEGIKARLEMLQAEKRERDLTFLYLLFSNIQIRAGAAVPKQQNSFDWLQQQNMINSLRNIENQLQRQRHQEMLRMLK